eukprot:981494-Pyramimonas_sp.AAC.1
MEEAQRIQERGLQMIRGFEDQLGVWFRRRRATFGQRPSAVASREVAKRHAARICSGARSRWRSACG